MKKSLSLFMIAASALLVPALTAAQQTETNPASTRPANPKKTVTNAETSTFTTSDGKTARPTFPVTPKRKFIDPVNMDLSVKPGDNFYQYANGNWLKNTPIPGKETRWGSFNVLIEEQNKKIQELKSSLSDFRRKLSEIKVPAPEVDLLPLTRIVTEGINEMQKIVTAQPKEVLHDVRAFRLEIKYFGGGNRKLPNWSSLMCCGNKRCKCRQFHSLFVQSRGLSVFLKGWQNSILRGWKYI